MAFLPCNAGPFLRDFGLAVDAATVAKRMQNGGAVEANLDVTPGQSATAGRDDCNHSGPPALRGRDPNRSPFQKDAHRGVPAYRLPRQHRWLRQMPRARIAEDPPKLRMMRDIGFLPPSLARKRVQARGLPEFPAIPGPKTRLNFAAFCQASSPLRHFAPCLPMSRQHPLRAITF
jgi:hypothetical protein